MENVTQTACAIAGIASLWAISAAINWAFLPWGASGLAKALIVVAFVGATSLILSFVSFRALLSRGLVLTICLLLLLFVIFTVVEVIYFRLVPDDHEMFRRQVHGALLSPMLAMMSSPLLFWRRRPTTFQRTRFQMLICAPALSASTVVFECILLWIRGLPTSTAYLGIASSMFSVAILSLVGLVAIASFVWPQSKKSVA
jgi:hypothetical protein